MYINRKFFTIVASTTVTEQNRYVGATIKLFKHSGCR